MNLRELAARLGCTLRGDGAVEVSRVRGIDDAGPGDLTFVSNPRYAPRLATTRASAVIVRPELDTPLPSLLAANPYHAFARAVALLHPQPAPPAGVHPTAVVDPTAELGEGVHVGALAVIGCRVRVGARTVIRPHVVLYPEAEVGEDCVLHSGVQVRERCRLGHRVIVQNGAVIGADGFGYRPDPQGRGLVKIPHIGTVQIGNGVEIGACSCVDRAKFGATVIGDGSKIDNHVQIGHNCRIGRCVIICGMGGIAGSVTIGDGAIIAGHVGIADNLTVGAGARIGAKSAVMSDVPAGEVWSGVPAAPHGEQLRVWASARQLPALVREFRRSHKAGPPGG